MNHNDEVSFLVKEVGQELPTESVNDACVIAFVPTQGFQWCKYYNGSHTWQSLVTGDNIAPTHWLMPK